MLSTDRIAFSYLWMKTAILFLLISIIIGAYLRMSIFYDPLKLNYRFILHTHSHVVLLGWAFNALCALILYSYGNLNVRFNFFLFFLLQLAVLGMLFTFPFQGYGLYSIISSTLHILFSYFFVFHFLVVTRGDRSWSTRFIRLGMIYFLISTAGPFSLGPIIVKGLSDSPAYDLAIYFYLHFLYNGFFVLTIIGLILRWLEFKKVAINHYHVKMSFRLIGFSVFPAYVLSTLGFYPIPLLYVIGVASAFVQIGGFFYLLKALWGQNRMDVFGKHKLILYTAFLSLGLKFLLQLVSAVPQMNKLVFESHGFIIAYLHLVFIGFVTFSILLLVFDTTSSPEKSPLLRTGVALFFIGFVVSELLIAYPSMTGIISLPDFPVYFQGLFWSSVIMLPGVGLLSIVIFRHSFAEVRTH